MAAGAAYCLRHADKAVRISHRKLIRKDKDLREHLTQRKIDKMLADSFPASDPPSNY